MHPNKFFKEVDCRISISLGEVFDQRLKEKLEREHPLNFLESRIIVPLYSIKMEYETIHNHFKSGEKFMIMEQVYDENGEHIIYAEIQAEWRLQQYAEKHNLKNARVISTDPLCDIVLSIG